VAQVTDVSAAGSLVWSSNSMAGPAGGSSQLKAAMLTVKVCANRGTAATGGRTQQRYS
jgi:hypothetical protein